MEMNWIPCSERLPDDPGMDVIVCISGRDRNIIYDHAVIGGENYYENGEWYIDNRRAAADVEVLAWMEHPEAYEV